MRGGPSAGARDGGVRVWAPDLPPWLAFAARAAVWVGFFVVVLRLPAVEAGLVIPFARGQQSLACALTGAPAGALRIGRSCSGADAMALSLGVVLAFPTTARRRIGGAAAGLALIAALNTVRLATLSLTAGERDLFQWLHRTAWPLVIVAAVSLYLIRWMGAARPPFAAAPPARGVRLGVGMALAVALYAAIEPGLARSPMVAAAARWTASVAGAALQALGVGVRVAGDRLAVAGRFWAVTPECLLTPLVPVWIAAALALPRRRWLRSAAVLAAVPAFLVLAVTRLLAVALPPALGVEPAGLVHGFRQLVAGGVAIGVVAWKKRRPGGPLPAALGRAAAAVILAVAVGSVAGRLDEGALRPLLAAIGGHLGHGRVDPQGALAMLPSFGAGLLAAVWAAGWRPVRRRIAAAVAGLVVLQIATVALYGEAAEHLALGMPVAIARALAVALPLTVAWWAAAPYRGGPPAAGGASAAGDPRYRGFWDEVGANFPDLGGAASTRWYRESEERLIAAYLPGGGRMLKTDLWDEVKNTRILGWAATAGHRCFGIDISGPITSAALRGFRRRGLRLGASLADVRALPFAEGSFDSIYSMGTVEHFAETDEAVGEIFRALRPGGRAILGVPNRHDPFLRPLLVAGLYRLGLYGYGFEKSYSRRGLRRLCEGAGFRVVAETGLLFVPGWLRMADLLCQVRWPRLARLTGLAVAPFGWLERRVPWLRRHGYLIAAVIERPER